MREYLFRGQWNKSSKEKEWVYGYLKLHIYKNSEDVTDKSAVIYFEDNSNIKYYIVNPETVGEFTGIYDSNGIRIFEGDILKAKNGHIGWVEFKKGCYVKVCNCHTSVSDIYSDNSEVIGNIFDNPELLEEN